MSESYSEQTLRNLRLIARERGIKYYSQMTKPRIVEMLEKTPRSC